MTPAPPNEDIVARARLCSCSDTLKEAVSEIERLRAENAMILKDVNWAYKVCHDLDDLRAERSLLVAIARQAEKYVYSAEHMPAGCEAPFYDWMKDALTAYRSACTSGAAAAPPAAAAPSQGEGER